jgi:hypothetical protein
MTESPVAEPHIGDSNYDNEQAALDRIAALNALVALIPPVGPLREDALERAVVTLIREGKLGSAIDKLQMEQGRLNREDRIYGERLALAQWLVEKIAAFESLDDAYEDLKLTTQDARDAEIANAEANAGWDPNP